MSGNLPPPTDAELARLPIFPLPDVVLFPLASLPLHVFEPRYRELARDVLAGDRLLAMARLRPGFEASYGGRPAVHEICGVGRIVEDAELPDGRYNILLHGLERVRIATELPPERAYREVRAERLPDLASSDPVLSRAWQQRLSALWNDLRPHLPVAVRDLRELTRRTSSVGAYADVIAAAVVADPDERQRLLEELDPAERLRMLVQHLQELSDAVIQERAPSRLN